MSYLEFYKKCMKTGRLPKSGLCGSMDSYESVNLFQGYHPQYTYNWHWGYNGEPYPVWDTISKRMQRKIEFEFTPLRQTVVLFLAAMNNEL